MSAAWKVVAYSGFILANGTGGGVSPSPDHLKKKLLVLILHIISILLDCCTEHHTLVQSIADRSNSVFRYFDVNSNRWVLLVSAHVEIIPTISYFSFCFQWACQWYLQPKVNLIATSFVVWPCTDYLWLNVTMWAQVRLFI